MQCRPILIFTALVTYVCACNGCRSGFRCRYSQTMSGESQGLARVALTGPIRNQCLDQHIGITFGQFCASMLHDKYERAAKVGSGEKRLSIAACFRQGIHLLTGGATSRSTRTWRDCKVRARHRETRKLPEEEEAAMPHCRRIDLERAERRQLRPVKLPVQCTSSSYSLSSLMIERRATTRKPRFWPCYNGADANAILSAALVVLLARERDYSRRTLTLSRTRSDLSQPTFAACGHSLLAFDVSAGFQRCA